MPHYAHHNRFTSDRLSGYERQQVDVAQTGFFEGREFRSFWEFTLTSSGILVTKFTSPVEFILFGQNLSVDEGKVRLDAKTGGTEGGSFSTARPIIGKNRMLERRAPYYNAQVTIASGGTHTGGTITETLHVATAGATGQATTVGEVVSDERGLPAGTYYLTLTNVGGGNASGVYSLWWEERGKHPDWKGYNTA